MLCTMLISVLVVISICIPGTTSITVSLNTGADVTIAYTYRAADAEVDFVVTAVTSNWLAIGFSPDTRMANTDVVVGFGSKVQDRYASRQAQPSIDATQDITNTETTVVGGTRTLKFTRSLTGTGSDDFDLSMSCPYLLAAVGGASDEASDTIQYHGAGRGVSLEKWCQLYQEVTATTKPPTSEPTTEGMNATSITMTNKPTTAPPGTTTSDAPGVGAMFPLLLIPLIMVLLY